MNIENVDLEIVSYKSEKFGFKFSFEKGLNLLTGHNSSGKSTVLSCIYYCLGLEQLIGSKGPKTLSPALRESFNYQGQTYQTVSSSCVLTILANDGNRYTLTRVIKDPQHSESLNKEIIIEGNGIKFSKYVHAQRDHDEHGFYRWLSDVNSLKILENEKEEGKTSKSLYMQNIFSLSFIEQTKGWSDFFSMLPSFGIKDVKQKIVEYCLNLNSLESRLKLDEIAMKKDEVKLQWKRNVSRIELKLDQLNFYIPQLSANTILPDTKLNKATPLILIDNKESDLDGYLKKLNVQIKGLNKIIDESSTSLTNNDKNLHKKEELITSIKNYEQEHLKVYELMSEEKEKQSRYSKMLSEIEDDLKDFQDIKWISSDRTWNKVANSKCPVCEQGLESISQNNINDDKVSKTSEFLKAQKELYKSYLDASTSSTEKYRAALTFYSLKIKSKRKELDLFSKDISVPSVLAIRAEMQRFAELNQRYDSVDEFISYFEEIKGNLVELSVQYFDYVEEEKATKVLLKIDDTTIISFERLFIKYLNKFGYKSNGTKSIHIKNSGSYPLIPQIDMFGQETQNIRFISSASDFVRSIWSYYISLLVLGKRHPGFLVLDEPGQHQMRLDSLVSLLDSAAGSGKQVIMAVSQDRKYDDKKVNIKELLQGLDEEEYNLLHIEDGNGCIVKKTSI
ncbi:hypothetical protein [Colwellia sp. UCD-KL20]|uniref:hypothetical protein n=1 Tax=Colwellia sp. UCD-KL20 TaxID=1917165 RepID=UPI000970AF10|nr:hypothetical protein [Colwellia sp. UCD-KL20]